MIYCALQFTLAFVVSENTNECIYCVVLDYGSYVFHIPIVKSNKALQNDIVQIV